MCMLHVQLNLYTVRGSLYGHHGRGDKEAEKDVVGG